MRLQRSLPFLAIFCSVCTDVLSDPCDPSEYTEINEPHRSISYTFHAPEVPLCDIRLPEKWYRFTSGAGDRMPESCVNVNQCGTVIPLWLNGQHPNVSEGVVSRKVCVNLPDSSSTQNCCEYAAYILVKNCEDKYFVYQLQPTPSCPMAYCAGFQRPCPSGQIGFEGNCTDVYPQLTSFPELSDPFIDGDTFYFSCYIHSINTANAVYEVKLTVNDEDIPGIPSTITSDTVPKLDGNILRGHLNKRVGCSVRSFLQQTPDITSPWFRSNNTYWAGIRIEPNRIEIEEGLDEETIYLVSTIPKVCNRQVTLENCYLSITLAVQENVSVNETCTYQFGPAQWNDTNKEARIPIILRAKMDHIRMGTESVVVEFNPIIDFLGVFDGFSITPVQVVVRDSEGRNCSSTGDPHIQGMEYRDSATYHLYDAGVFTLYENKLRYFEVQTRTTPCYKGDVTCNCAVAIREYNDVFIIDNCDAPASAPELRVSNPVSDAIKIMRSRDLSDTVVYLPSSTEVKVTKVGNGVLNVMINIPSGDMYHGRGLCGTFDGVDQNEFLHRGFGQVDTCTSHSMGPMGCIPKDFTASWRIDDDASNLFISTPPRFAEGNRLRTFCTCYKSRDLSCSDRGAVGPESMPCTPPPCNRLFGNDSTSGGSTHRKKRFISDTDVDESQSTYDPNLYRDFRPRTDFSWPTPSGITEQKAEEMCRSAIQSSQLWSVCSDQNVTKNIDLESCKIDILVSDSTDFIDSHVNAFMTNCHLAIVTNPANNVKTASGEIVLKAEFSVVSEICSLDCLRIGHCDQGRCVCPPGRTGISCQLEEGLGPQLNKIIGSNTCDINMKPCRKIFINASNFEWSPTLSCSVQEIALDGSSSASEFVEKADPISDQKLACYLPESGVPSEISAKTFAVKATTDGVLYGNELRVTVFDSTCLSCNGSECTKLPDTCLIHNVCYQDGDLNPRDSSQICNTFLNTSEWSPTPTIPSDYPLMTDPTLAFDSGAGVYTCTVHSTDTKLTVRYKVSWIIDGELIPNTRELNIPANQNQAVFQSSQLPSSGMLACKVRSYYSDRNIYSPYFTSNVEDLSNRGV